MTQIFVKKALAVRLTASVFGAVALAAAPALLSPAMANTLECSAPTAGSSVSLGPITNLSIGDPMTAQDAMTRWIRIDRGKNTWMKTGLFTVTFSEGVTLIDRNTMRPISMPVSQGNASILNGAMNIEKFGPMEPSRCQGTKAGCWYQHNVTPISAQMVGGKTVVTMMIGKPGDRREAAEMEGMKFTFFLKSSNSGSVFIDFADETCNSAGLGTGKDLKNIEAATVSKAEIFVTVGVVPSAPSGTSGQSVADVTVRSTATIPAGSEFTATLTDGATWDTLPSCAVQSVSSACSVRIDPTDPTKVIITVLRDLPAGKEIYLSGGKINTSKIAPGTDVYLTLTSTGQNKIGYFGTHRVKVAAVTWSGDSSVEVSYVDENISGYDIVFAGRRDQQIFDRVKLVETKPGSLVRGGTIVYTLSSGVIVYGGSLTTTNIVNELGISCDPVTAPEGSNSASCRILGSTSTTPGTAWVALNGNILSLLGVDAGSLYATISGTATTNWNNSTVKVAEIVRASNTIPAGGVVTLQPGNKESQINDIIINETRPGALIQGRIVLALDDGLYLKTVGTTAAKVFDANNNLVYSLPVSTSDRAAPGTLITDPTKRAIEFTLPQSSTQANGPYKIIVSNLFVEAMTDSAGSITTPEKYYSMTIGGDLSAATVAAKLQSDTGAKPWSQTFEMVRVTNTKTDREGGAWLDMSGAISKQAIYGNWTIGSAALGKPGSLYLMIRMPPITDDSGFVVTHDWTAWSASSQQWELITDWTSSGICEKLYPLYTTNSLQDIRDMMLVAPSTNMTAFRNTQVYMGYGVSTTGNSVEACLDMINSGTYWTAGLIQ